MKEWEAASGETSVSVKSDNAEDALYEALGHALTWKMIAHEAARAAFPLATKKEIASFLVQMAGRAAARAKD